MTLVRTTSYILLLALLTFSSSCTDDEEEGGNTPNPPVTGAFDLTVDYGGNQQNYGQNYDFATSTSFVILLVNEELKDAIDQQAESEFIDTSSPGYEITEILLDQVVVELEGIYQGEPEVTASEIILQKDLGLGDFEETILATMNFYDFSENRIIYSLTNENLAEVIANDPERIIIRFTFDGVPFEISECWSLLTFEVSGTTSE